METFFWTASLLNSLLQRVLEQNNECKIAGIGEWRYWKVQSCVDRKSKEKNNDLYTSSLQRMTHDSSDRLIGVFNS